MSGATTRTGGRVAARYVAPSNAVRRRLVSCLVLVGALLAAAPARADSGPAWGAIADRVAGSMEALQQSDGSLADYLSPTAQPYAEAMVGYGLLLHGLRRGDRRATDAGLRAIGQTVQPGIRGGPRLDSVFKQLAVASSYRLATERLAGDPVFESRRAAIETWLREVRPVHLTATTGAAGNKHLVEAVADLELIHSGLSGGAPGTITGDPNAALARVISLIDARWPAAVEAQLRPGPFGPTAVVSDPPSQPLAYHALALAMYDRAIALLGVGATGGARTALAAMARGSALLAGPDGDLAYWGRSQEQSWALALTAAGADALGADGAPGRRRAERLRARAAERIDRVHGFGPYGVWIVPALRTDAAAGRAAMDDYAANGVYNGLTLVGAEWALSDGEYGVPIAAPTGPLGADAGGAWRIGRGAAAFAVSRRRATWFAVRMRAGTGEHRGDPRYAFGLMAAKHRTGGRWRDLVAAPPRPLGAADAPGPSLVLRDGTLAEPYGSRIRTSRRGAITVIGGFRTAAGRVVRHGVRFVFAPTPTGGVSVSFGVRRRDRVDVADFRAAGSRPVTVRLRPRGRRVRALPSTPLVRSGYASATLGRVVRVGARVRVARTGTLTWLPRG
jgi:hypothetical protein